MAFFITMAKSTVAPKPPRKNAVQSFRSLNRNVQLVLAFTLAQSLGGGIWMGNMLSTFIYLIAGSSNQLLGLTSAATGFTMTLVVFPAGAIADRFRRDWMLRIGAGLGVISAVFLFVVEGLLFILLSLIFYGLFNGLINPALEALFADSIKSGARSGIYSWRHLIGQIGNAVGPFLNILLLSIFGDEWHLTILKSVIGVGLFISVLSYGILFLFRDEHSLKGESDSVISAELTPVPQAVQENIAGTTIEHREVIPASIGLQSRIKLKWVPYILLACNIIIGLGAGMTIKFFPIFFMEIYAMKPIAVEIISGLTAVVTGFSGLLAQHFSRVRGRPQLIFAVQGIATLCLMIIALYPPTAILIIVFILRGALMNASQPLSLSILMDLIPKEKRGKWNSMEALAWGLFWNFSAILGGYLIGPTNNFRLNFVVTACIYVCGTMPVLLLFKIVAKEPSGLKSKMPQKK